MGKKLGQTNLKNFSSNLPPIFSSGDNLMDPLFPFTFLNQFSLPLEDPLCWLLERGKRCYEAQDFANAKPILLKIIQMAPSQLPLLMFSHVCLGRIFSSENNAAKLKHHYLSAISLDPDRSDLRFQLGFYLLQLGRFREAAASFRSACERDPSHVDYHRFFAQSLIQMDRIAEAKAVYKKMMKRNSSHLELLHEYALFLLNHQYLDDAAFVLQKALEIAPENPQIVKAHQLLQFLKKNESSGEEKQIFEPVDPPTQSFSIPTSSKKPSRVHMDGFSFVFTPDAHWVDVDEDRQEDYKTYLSKQPIPLLPFSKWREHDDEFLRLCYLQTLKDLEVPESQRFEQLKKVLMVD